MTGAKEPLFIESLLHSETCGRSRLYAIHEHEVCSIAEIVNHIDMLTAERDAAVQDAARQLDLRYAANRELVALQRETDALRKNAERVCQWREDDPESGTWRTGCGHLWSFNAGGPEENDTKFCQYCGGALNAACTADATSSFADSLIGIHEATQCDGCGMFSCRCTRGDDAEVSA